VIEMHSLYCAVVNKLMWYHCSIASSLLLLN